MVSYEELRPQLNWYGQLIDLQQRQRYHAYFLAKGHHRPLIFLEFVALAYTFYLIPFHLYELYFEWEKESNLSSSNRGHALLISLLLIGLIVLGILSALTIICSTRVVIHHPSSTTSQHIPQNILSISTLNMMFFLSTSLYAILLFGQRNLFPICDIHSSSSCSSSLSSFPFLSSYTNYLWIGYNCGENKEYSQTVLYESYPVYMFIAMTFMHCPSVPIEIVWSTLVLAFTVIILSLLKSSQINHVLIPSLFWFICCIVVIMDVHLRNLLEAIAAERDEQQRESFALDLKHAIANVAHDLKTPLSSFINGVDILENLWNDMLSSSTSQVVFLSSFRRQFEDCLKNIKSTNIFMMMAINRCIDSTKGSSGMKLIAKNESIDLVESLRLPLSIMATVQSKIKLRLILDESVENQVATHIITDKQWLQENLLCLLSNAVKYSNKGLVTLRVSLSSSNDTMNDTVMNISDHVDEPLKVTAESNQSDDHIHRTSETTITDGVLLVFEVEDEGIGLSEDAHHRLFNPFQQTQRLAGGTGLGLYSLAKRCEAIKGYCGVRGRKDGKAGSLFWFSIPYRPDFELSKSHCISRTLSSLSNDALQNPIVYRLPSNSTRTTSPVNVEDEIELATNEPLLFRKPLNILLVDDAPTVLKLTSTMLRRMSCQVTTADNGLDAVEILTQPSPPKFDLVLIDLQMPIMDGLEACRRIRRHSNPQLENLCIIGLSANIDDETIDEAIEVGMNRFLPKPLTQASFTALMKEILPTNVLRSHDKEVPEVLPNRI